MRRLTDADEFKLIREQIENPPAGESQLHTFLRHFWDVIEPRNFVDGRHLHAKCEVLTAVSKEQITDLVINEPPGSCKSLLVSVFWPAFHWATVRASEAWLFAAFEQELVNRDAQKFLDLLTSDRFKGVFPEFRLGRDKEKKAIESFYNTHKGMRYGTTPGGSAIGWHFGIHVYDDLIKPAALIDGVSAEHQGILKKTNTWIRETASMRKIPGQQLRRVLIAQRLHEGDPSGAMLADGWEHLCFPEEYTPNASWIMGDLTAKHEWRTVRGEPLWPELRPATEIAKSKRVLKTPSAISAQLDQNPTPATGGVLQATDFKRFDTWPDFTGGRFVWSLDLSFKDNKGKAGGSQSAESSRVGWQLWFQAPEDREYLIDASAQHMSYSESKRLIKDLAERPLWNRADVWLVEAKANGPALESDLKDDYPQIELFEPGNVSKVGRMLPFVDRIRQGFVMYPSERLAPWIAEVLDEIVKVPRGTFDEHWDCQSQGLAFLRTNSTNYAEAARKLKAAMRG